MAKKSETWKRKSAKSYAGEEGITEKEAYNYLFGDEKHSKNKKSTSKKEKTITKYKGGYAALAENKKQALKIVDVTQRRAPSDIKLGLPKATKITYRVPRITQKTPRIR